MPVQTVDFSTARWSWKERDSAGDFSDVASELQRPYTSDETSPGVTTLVKADREAIKEKWFPATKFPSEVHVELLAREVITHPYVAFNEHEVQWVGETEWLYTCTFDAPIANGDVSHRLAFDGLDTLCDVYLNGQRILQTDNAFRQWVYDIKGGDAILTATDNVLLLHFQCAKAYAKAQEAVYGKVRAGSTNLGDPSRVYLRKPQYDWRWDWGPELMTCGPYRNVTLSTYAARIRDLHPQATLDFTGQECKFHLKASFSFDVAMRNLNHLHATNPVLPFHVSYSVKASNGEDLVNGKVVATTKDVVDHIDASNDAYATLELPLDLDNALEGNTAIKPWWPVGYGDQNLYTFELALVNSDGQILDSISKRFGWRSVELVQELLQEPDQYGTGTTFFFKVNGVEMFMGGSNWIPADNFLTTISDERYRKWLNLLRDGGQNMVRIWGGGIYEPDIFYDICDELGLLVWQDFQFACGVYPAHDSFVKSVREEAVYNVSRLKHHPSIALFCGNNEDYQMVLQWGDVAHLPAVVIYEEVLPEVVDSLTERTIPYHRGSPYGGKGWDTADPTIGDVHQWNIWGGKELPWQEYPKLGGRFVSEFGIPAFPSMKTIECWMEGVDPREWYAQSKVMAQHTRAGAFERRFAITMNENFRLTADLEKHAFNTQVMQAEAVGLAYRAWKKEWKAEGKRYCGGVLVWQFNDCWPVTSWSLVDYFLRPKPSYYVIARELAPLTVGIYREVVQNRDNDRPKQFYEYGATRSTSAKFHIWATRAGTGGAPLQAKLDIKYFDLENPEWHWQQASGEAPILAVAPNGTTELGTFECPEPGVLKEDIYRRPGTTTSGRVVVSARLLHPDSGEVLARFVDWPQPYRLLDIPSREDSLVQLDVTRHVGSEGTATVRVSVKRPVKCLVLSVSGPGGSIEPAAGNFGSQVWSDNALDVVPGDTQCRRYLMRGPYVAASGGCMPCSSVLLTSKSGSGDSPPGPGSHTMQPTNSCSTSQTSSHLRFIKKPRRGWIRKLKSRVFEHSTHPSATPSEPCEKNWRKFVAKLSPLGTSSSGEEEQEYQDFIREYPEYRLTHPLDSLRQSDFTRLERSGETYVDYMGGALYPESLITRHADFLKSSVLGNTHSINNSSQASSRHASEARSAVLAFFQTPPEYTVVFTSNASAALKLVGESYQFEDGSAFVLAADSHNSVNGIREFANGKGAHCTYIPSTPAGGFDRGTAQTILSDNRPESIGSASCLFALTGQSNISNWKAPLDITGYASSLAYHVLLDAAALAPTSLLSLSAYPAIDAMAVSFYKMFGFPTGIGALIVKKSFLEKLKRPWFSGGTVDIVQVPGMNFTRAEKLYEQFEDGTINYTMLPAITHGLRFLSSYMSYLPLRLSCLLEYLITSLERLRHDTNGEPVVRILSMRPSPVDRIRNLGGQSNVGSLVSLVFLDSAGILLPNTFIEHAASLSSISLRTGCACNSGASMAMLGISEVVERFEPGMTQGEMGRRLGQEVGVVRISLGLVSNFEDVRRVIQFASLLAIGKARESMHTEWARNLPKHQ